MSPLQTISVLMVALNILYLLVDETAMPKGSTVTTHTHTHTHTHTQNLVIGAVFSQRLESDSRHAKVHCGNKGPDVNQSVAFRSSLKVISHRAQINMHAHLHTAGQVSV